MGHVGGGSSGCTSKRAFWRGQLRAEEFTDITRVGCLGKRVLSCSVVSMTSGLFRSQCGWGSCACESMKWSCVAQSRSTTRLTSVFVTVTCAVQLSPKQAVKMDLQKFITATVCLVTKLNQRVQEYMSETWSAAALNCTLPCESGKYKQSDEYHTCTVTSSQC